MLDAAARGAHGRRVDRFKLALSLLALGVVPLFYVSTWLGVAAIIAIYSLIARLANKDFDRRYRKQRQSAPPLSETLTAPHRATLVVDGRNVHIGGRN